VYLASIGLTKHDAPAALYRRRQSRLRSYTRRTLAAAHPMRTDAVAPYRSHESGTFTKPQA